MARNPHPHTARHHLVRWLARSAGALALLGLGACSHLPTTTPQANSAAVVASAPPAAEPVVAGAAVNAIPPIAPVADVNVAVLPPHAATRRKARPLAPEDSPPHDLWARLRQGFALPELQGEAAERAARAAQSYARSGLLQRSAGRAQRYLYPFVAEAEKRGLPLELALLPYVESALNPHARSPVGAVGACQFMPATGKRFALAQSTWVDQRRDLARCANAMFDYLSENHARFGSWHLALAAYNWGEGAVTRAQEKNRAAGLPTYYEALRMPAETQNYVPALLGLAAVVAEPERYQAPLPALPNLPPWIQVPLPADMDVRRVLQFAGISQAEFEQLNPGIFRPVIPKAVQSSIALPPAAAARFATALAKQHQPLASWGSWRVPHTQRLGPIAKALGTQAQTLAQANDIPPGHLVLAGSVLAVPKATAQDIDPHSAEAGVLRTALPPPNKTKRKSPPPRATTPPRATATAILAPKPRAKNV